MVDAVADLTAQTDATLAGLTALVTEIQKDVALLAATPKDNTDAVEAQVARLKEGTDAAAAALAALQPAPTVEPAPEPAPEPTPEQPAPEAPAA